MTGLDGIRGFAALYVVLHHCWLLSFPGYPANTGPWWVGGLVYGHLAVVVFITLSGFSLAISPARYGWRLGGLARFARRRAWRILPPYWAALGLSMAVATIVGPLPHLGSPNPRSTVVYGLLLQDFVRAPVPNGAFWSIAVEAGLYFALPVLLLVRRRWGAVAVLALATVPVVALGLLRPGVSTVDKATGLTLQFAPMFAVGVAAAGVLTVRRRLPWHWFACAATVPVVVPMVLNGPVWTERHYYWLDIAIGPGVALLLASVAVGRPSLLVRLLGTRPMRALGSFSYSLYLIHVPVVVVVAFFVARPHFSAGLPRFWVTLAIAAPLAVLVAWGFGKVFEIPFQRYRSFAELRSALSRPPVTRG